MKKNHEFDVHPSFDITGTLSNALAGKRIVLCVTGSVAAVKAPDLARLLMRHGAEVFCVMSKAACSIIHPDLMYWATGNKPIKKITGSVEHVMLAGNTKTKADIVIAAPCTANTIGKIAAAIDDTPVTTFVTTALGEKIPLLIVPAMHAPMYNHQFVKENIDKLVKTGISVMQPRMEEGKAKFPEIDVICNKIIEMLCENKILKGKKVLVTAGRTVEYIDPVRVITNNSSGKMGTALAEKALKAGAEVTLVAGKITVLPDSRIKVVYTETAQDMYNAVHKELAESNYDIFLSAAAVGDFQAEQKAAKKISTHNTDTLVLKLKPTPKILDSIREKYQSVYIVAFRALHNMSEAELVEDGLQRMEKAGANMIAINDVSLNGAGFESDTNEMIVITQNKNVEKIQKAHKSDVADKIIAIIARDMNIL